ncbi:MAG: hypothetical protein V2A69_04525 [Pseudomonadota bacterium]
MSDKKSLSKEVKIGIAGVVISVVPEGAFPGFGFDDAYRSFITEDEPEVILRLHYGELVDDYDLGEKIFDSDSTWSFHRRNGKYVLRICYFSENSTPDRIAILEPDFRRGEVYISNRSNEPITLNPLLYPFAELLMINLLSLDRGTLIHACGISDGSQGILFVGTSGAGKSTLAHFWKDRKDVTVLSDDRIIIRKMDGQFWMYGTPWHGDAKACSPERAPLEKIFFLKHAEKNEIKKMTPMEATSRLMVCSFPTFWDKIGMEFTLGFIDELTREVPCYELGFVPDESVLDLVKSI